MSLLYHVYLTTESDPAGAVVYWAEHREVPWQAPGATRAEALAKLDYITRLYLADCDARGVAPKPFVTHALVFDCTYSRVVPHGRAAEN